MQISKANRCQTCAKVFCCPKCREDHVNQEHPGLINADCSICNEKKLIWKSDVEPDLLKHIIDCHLPLKCSKCHVQVECEADFAKMDRNCELKPAATKHVHFEMDSYNKLLPTCKGDKRKSLPAMKLSGDDSPPIVNCKEIATQTNVETPIPNMNWKLIKQSYNNVDNMSLVQNTYTAKMRASRNSIGSQLTTSTQVIRTTSTPTQEIMCVFQANHFINKSSVQLSGVFNHTSSDIMSPDGIGLGTVPMAPKVGANYPWVSDKFGRPYGSNSQTPLRQAMSNNAQRAFLNHDIRLLFNAKQQETPRSITSNSEFCPLDLRTTPVIRRYQLPTLTITHDNDPDKENITEDVSHSDCPRTPSPSKTKPEEEPFVDSCIYFTPISTIGDYDGNDYEDHSEISRRSLICNEYSSELEDHAAERHEIKGTLWSVLTSVFRFATWVTGSGDEEIKNDKVSHSSDRVKRRRYALSPISPVQVIKRTKIQGRPPIARMRFSRHEERN